MIDTDGVKYALGLPKLTAPEERHLGMVTAAVNDYVTQIHPDPWRSSVIEGALLLACRLYTRRNSPTGIAAFGEMGGAYVARYDPDVERLLEIGRFAKGVVA